MEGKLFLSTFAPYVERKYQCEVITLHDGIFVKESDYLRLEKNIPDIDDAWYHLLENGEIE